MAETKTTRGESPLEQVVHLALGETLDVDAAYCDVVHAREVNGSGPFELRFRGQRRPDNAFVRLFVPLEDAQFSMMAEGIIAQAINTDHVPPVGQGTPVAVALKHHALRFTKLRKGNGRFGYRVELRDLHDETDLASYLQCLHAAAEQAAPVLKEAGYAVGAAEVLTIAGDLFAVRTHRLRAGNQRKGANHGTR